MIYRDSRRVVGVPFVCALVAALGASPALAAPQDPGQGRPIVRDTREPERARSVQIMFGVDYLLAQLLGTGSATMLADNTTPAPYKYFDADGSRAAVPAFRGGIGYQITDTVGVEGSFLFGKGDLRATVTNDAENVSSAVITGTMTQYFIDLSIVARLRQAAFSNGNGLPFVEAGGGYLRQMQEGNFAVVTGQIYHLGGGVTYYFNRRPARRMSGIGFRAQARLYLPRKALTFDAGQHVFASLNAGFVVAF